MKNRRTIVFLLVLVIIWSGPKLIVSEIESQPAIYWTGSRKIMKIQLNNMGSSNGQSILTTGLEGPYDIALDIRRNKMYWTVAGKIQSADLDGSNAKDVITGLDHLRDIALDVKAGKIYWTQGHKICCAGLDGTNVQNLISGLNYPRSIALNVQDSKIYWTEGSPETSKTSFTLLDSKEYWVEGTPNTAKICCAGLDGTNVQDLVTTGLDYPDGIALDVENGKIYWTQYLTNSLGTIRMNSLGKIRCADLDGTNIQNLVTGLGRPEDIALDVAGSKMYWIDTEANKIQCSNLYGIGVQDVTIEVIGLKSIAVLLSK